MQHHVHKMIETTGSLIEQMLPKSIQAVTAEGFRVKGGAVRLGLQHHSRIIGCNLSQDKAKILSDRIFFEDRRVFFEDRGILFRDQVDTKSPMGKAM